MYPSSPALSLGQLRLMLPIQIKEVDEYVFVFDVNYLYDHPDRLNLEKMSLVIVTRIHEAMQSVSFF